MRCTVLGVWKSRGVCTYQEYLKGFNQLINTRNAARYATQHRGSLTGISTQVDKAWTSCCSHFWMCAWCMLLCVVVCLVCAVVCLSCAYCVLVYDVVCLQCAVLCLLYAVVGVVCCCVHGLGKHVGYLGVCWVHSAAMVCMMWYPDRLFHPDDEYTSPIKSGTNNKY